MTRYERLEKGMILHAPFVVLGATAVAWLALATEVVIGKGAFTGFANLAKLTFRPDSRLERIEEEAFCETGLKSIVIPSSVVVLGKCSFAQCKSLESVSFESGSRLERIEDGAFRFSPPKGPTGGALKEIVIPASVAFLGEAVFARMKSLESVTFEAGSRLERIGGHAFLWTGLKRFVIPSSVVFLGNYAFNCTAIASIAFEAGCRLERMEVGLFAWAHVATLAIPACVVALEKESFKCCPLLSVEFEDGSRLERIGESAFSQDGRKDPAKLKSIVIPAGVVDLGKASFYKCTSLENVTFETGSRLEVIGDSAFAETSLKKIVIPASVVSLGKESFAKCRWLSVKFEKDSALSRIGESAFGIATWVVDEKGKFSKYFWEAITAAGLRETAISRKNAKSSGKTYTANAHEFERGPPLQGECGVA
jgi:RNase P/RNase MRP subunit POP5